MPKRRASWKEEFAAAAVKYAVGMGAEGELAEALPKPLQPYAQDLAEAVFSALASKRGGPSYSCALCGRSCLTKKGLYLHAVRVHLSELAELVGREAEKLLELSAKRFDLWEEGEALREREPARVLEEEARGGASRRLSKA